MSLDENSVATRRTRRIHPETLLMDPPDPPSRGGSVGRYIAATVLILFLASVLFYIFSYSNFTGSEIGSGELEELIADAKNSLNVSESSSDAATVPLHVSTLPSGATVHVDFEPVGKAPVDQHLRPGAYVISVQMENYATFDTVLFIERGKPQQIQLALAREDEVPSDEIFGRSDGPAGAASIGSSIVEPVERPIAGANSGSDGENTPPRDNSPAESENDRSSAGAITPETVNVPEGRASDAASNTSVFAELVVSSHPAGADAFLDGMHVGTTPFSMRGVPTGTRSIRLSLDEYEHYMVDISAVAGETTTIHAELAKRSGTLSVLVRPWGSIYIDGVLHKRNSDVKYETTLPTGEYTVMAVHPELGSTEKTITIHAGTTQEVVFNLERDMP